MGCKKGTAINDQGVVEEKKIEGGLTDASVDKVQRCTLVGCSIVKNNWLSDEFLNWFLNTNYAESK